MATTIDYGFDPHRIIIPQADLTLITGSLYELDTDDLRIDLKALEASESGMVWQDTHRHNLPYTVQGVTYAQSIEVINTTVDAAWLDEHEIFFSPDTTYSVRLSGSNNNVSDIQNLILANTVTQVIPQNSAGLILVSSGSGLSTPQDEALTRIDNATIYHSKIINNYKELIKIATSWYLVIYDDGEISGGTEILRKKMEDAFGDDITDLVAGVLAAELETTA